MADPSARTAPASRGPAAGAPRDGRGPGRAARPRRPRTLPCPTCGESGAVRAGAVLELRRVHAAGRGRPLRDAPTGTSRRVSLTGRCQNWTPSAPDASPAAPQPAGRGGRRGTTSNSTGGVRRRRRPPATSATGSSEPSARLPPSPSRRSPPPSLPRRRSPTPSPSPRSRDDPPPADGGGRRRPSSRKATRPRTTRRPAPPQPSAEEVAHSEATAGEALLNIALKDTIAGGGLRFKNGKFLLHCPAGHPVKVDKKHAGKVGRCPTPGLPAAVPRSRPAA